MTGRFVIRNSNGKYVACAGSESSFTAKIENARRFETREAAQIDCCGNEWVEEIGVCSWATNRFRKGKHDARSILGFTQARVYEAAQATARRNTKTPTKDRLV